ncbi:MAG: hypothetical protein EBT44_02920 [Actinobacteria bacterium]|uniref:Uncharacterized protein n=1 Tax=Candidatus Fonsibacter lacus TaxID=2576439 RepID=A0A965GCX8_9PROT|nr:hypothetical protein [Candidatus Fonsibacter lacus]
MSAQLMLPPCANADQRMCIDGLALSTGTTGNAKLEEATLDHEVRSLTTPADPVTGLPAGGGPSLWNSPTIANKAGSKSYGVAVRVTYFQNREKIGSAGKRNNPISLQSMRVSVFPISVVSGKYYDLESYKSVNSDGAQSYGIRQKGNGYDNLQDCAWTETGSCAKYGDFAENTRVSLTLRMGSEMTGWLYGRMKDVNVAVTPLDKTFNKITIEGAPIAAPGAYGVIKKSELKNNPKIDERIRLSYGEFGYNEMINSPTSGGGGYDPVGNFADFAAFEPILKTMPSARAQWVISSGASANGYQPQVTSQCFKDKTKLLGIVTTNALIYENGAPEFRDGTLNYKVAGLHHTEDGVTLTRGTYDLAIRSETARCVYGFTDAPFQASISVIGSDGQEQTIATESIREDAKREWLFLSAQNFTFSSPVIKVKLTQEKKLSATKPTPPIAKKSATQTITCVKGKLVKKVSGTAPKCPAGYKKR